MSNASSSAGDEAAQFFGTLLVASLVVCGLAVGGLIWLAYSAGYRYYERQMLTQEANSVFDRLRAQTYPDLDIDPWLRAIYGDDIDLQPAGALTRDDWAVQALFGMG